MKKIIAFLFIALALSGVYVSAAGQGAAASMGRQAGNGETEIIIRRAEMPVHSGFKERIYVDGVQKLVLENGDVGKIIIPNGEHTIYAELYTMTSEKLRFTAQSNVSTLTIKPYSLQNFVIELTDGDALPQPSQLATRSNAPSAPVAAPAVAPSPRAAPAAAALARLPSGPRYALVIGNANYQGIAKLTNTINDSTDVAAALKKLGYQVDLKQNASEKQLFAAVEAYVAKLKSNRDSEGFFWYAGHGIQIKDQNYLLPVDVDVENERTVSRGSLSLNELLAEFESAHNKVNVVILDACRNNPLPSSSRSAGSRGLAVVQDVPSDLFIMFSTAPGDTAADGSGRNSPFAQAFLKYLDVAQPVTMLAVDITSETVTLTGGKQRPFSRGSIISDKYYSLRQ